MTRESIINWHYVLLKMLDIHNISYKALAIEGLNLLVFLSKHKNYKHNKRLVVFVKSGWMDIVKHSSNKVVSIVNYKIWFDRKTTLLKTRGLKKSQIRSTTVTYHLGYERKYWLAIGINDYKTCNGMNDLYNAVNDANAITDFACGTLGFRARLLTNKNASKASIENLLQRELFNTMNHNDLFVLSFHGHGHTILIGDCTHGFIIPFGAVDLTPASLISMDTISSWMKLLKCRHIVLILDCCFSGIMGMRGSPPSKPSLSPRTEIRRRSIYQNLCRKSRIVINAGNEDQSIQDGGLGNNSILTGLIISYNRFQETDGSVYSLFSYLIKEVPKYADQTPTMGKLIGDRGGDIYLTF